MGRRAPFPPGHAGRKRGFPRETSISHGSTLDWSTPSLSLFPSLSFPIPLIGSIYETVKMSIEGGEDHNTIHSYFIGPKGANLPDFRANINTILDELLEARLNYYPEDDVRSNCSGGAPGC